ncbi:hypothetical protein [Methylobacterium sp. J-072]|uniref:hypothetical protein n=1 Tax=Methylobacterium sp. J-072 TaxID=2836651 RepID=UPI003919B2F8
MTILRDEISWERFTAIAWTKDGSGFFYSRFPEPEKEAADLARSEGHAVRFHAVGTPQSRNRLIHSTPGRPHLSLIAGAGQGAFASNVKGR